LYPAQTGAPQQNIYNIKLNYPENTNYLEANDLYHGANFFSPGGNPYDARKRKSKKIPRKNPPKYGSQDESEIMGESFPNKKSSLVRNPNSDNDENIKTVVPRDTDDGSNNPYFIDNIQDKSLTGRRSQQSYNNNNLADGKNNQSMSNFLSKNDSIYINTSSIDTSVLKSETNKNDNPKNSIHPGHKKGSEQISENFNQNMPNLYPYNHHAFEYGLILPMESMPQNMFTGSDNHLSTAGHNPDAQTKRKPKSLAKWMCADATHQIGGEILINDDENREPDAADRELVNKLLDDEEL
jgi:hypothetical protein